LTTCGPGAKESRPLPTEPGDYRLFYANIRDAILGIAPPAVTTAQALEVMRLLEQASKS
jgi:predicted dehydrogenase